MCCGVCLAVAGSCQPKVELFAHVAVLPGVVRYGIALSLINLLCRCMSSSTYMFVALVFGQQQSEAFSDTMIRNHRPNTYY